MGDQHIHLLFIGCHGRKYSVAFLSNFYWLAKVAYFIGIFTYLNELNLSLQGVAANILKVEDKIEAIRKESAYGQNGFTTVCMR